MFRNAILALVAGSMSMPLTTMASEAVRAVPIDRALIVPMGGTATLVAAPLLRAAPPDRHLVERRNRWIVGSSLAVFFLVAGHHWWREGFSNDFRMEREGGFGVDTRSGGVDKLGHLFSNYVGVRLLHALLAEAGNDARSALRIATLTSVVNFAAVEVLDGYSRDFAFSPEDMLANLTGAALGYAMLSYPDLDRLIDVRFNYRPSGSGRWDPLADYDGQRFFVALKADGVPHLREWPATRYAELVLGYGATGFNAGPEASSGRRRSFYAGIGVNLSRALSDAAYGGREGSTRTQRVAEGAFEFLQLGPALLQRRDLD